MAQKKLAAIPLALAPNERIVTLLREALRDAKEGKIHAIGVAIAMTSDNPQADGARATESVLCFTPGWGHSLATAVNGLAFRLNHERYTQGDTLPEPKLEDTDE
jgi:hypothetical protein